MGSVGKLPYRIMRREQLYQGEWNAFVDLADEGWLWHLRCFQDVMIKRGLTDVSFAVQGHTPGHEILAVVPLHLRHRKELGLIRWKTMHSHGGPALKNLLGHRQRRKVLAAIHAHLLAIAQQYKVAEITFSLPPMAPAYRGERCPLVNPLLHLGCENTMMQTWIVDLRRPLEEIRRAYSYQTRRDLRNARTSGFEIREAKGRQDLDEYYALHLETCQRTRAIPHPYAYFRQVFESCIPSGVCRVVFFIQDGMVLAGQATGLYKGGAHYWFGASRTDKPQHGGENRTLFDDQIQYARQNGAEWYMMGDALVQGKLEGISEFKGSFGSVVHPYYQGRIVVKRGMQLTMRHLDALRVLRE